MRYEFRDKFSVFSFRFAAFSKRPHAIFALSELSSAQTRPPPFIEREQRAASGPTPVVTTVTYEKQQPQQFQPQQPEAGCCLS